MSQTDLEIKHIPAMSQTGPEIKHIPARSQTDLEIKGIWPLFIFNLYRNGSFINTH